MCPMCRRDATSVVGNDDIETVIVCIAEFYFDGSFIRDRVQSIAEQEPSK